MRYMRIVLVSIVTCLLLVSNLYPSGTRTNITYTVTAGTPQRLATVPTLVNEISIQMKHGATVSMGYVMAGIPDGTVPSKTNVAHVTMELDPATATTAGGQYHDQDQYGIDISLIWVDVDTTGTKVIVSYDLR